MTAHARPALQATCRRLPTEIDLVVAWSKLRHSVAMWRLYSPGFVGRTPTVTKGQSAPHALTPSHIHEREVTTWR
jgi:hypothetical protein